MSAPTHSQVRLLFEGHSGTRDAPSISLHFIPMRQSLPVKLELGCLIPVPTMSLKGIQDTTELFMLLMFLSSSAITYFNKLHLRL